MLQLFPHWLSNRKKRKLGLVSRGVTRYSAALHNCPSCLTLMQDDDQRLRKLDYYLCPSLCPQSHRACFHANRQRSYTSSFLIPFHAHTNAYIYSDSVLVLLLSCSWCSNAPLSTSLTQLDSGRWTEEVNEVISASAAPAIFFKYVWWNKFSLITSLSCIRCLHFIAWSKQDLTQCSSQFPRKITELVATLFWRIWGGNGAALCIITAAG